MPLEQTFLHRQSGLVRPSLAFRAEPMAAKRCEFSGTMVCSSSKLQGADKAGRAALGQEVQRAAEESDMAADRLAAGKTGDGLVDDRLEDGGGQVLLGRALVDQRLDIRLGKNAAARGDRIDGLVVPGVLVQSGGVGLQKRGHLVDEGAGAAGADAVHALLDIAVLKIDDLRVLAAELDGDVGLRSIKTQRRRDGNDLLDKRHVQMLCEGEAAASGDDRMHCHIPKFPPPPQEDRPGSPGFWQNASGNRRTEDFYPGPGWRSLRLWNRYQYLMYSLNLTYNFTPLYSERLYDKDFLKTTRRVSAEK